MSGRRVLIVQRRMTAYRVPLFEALRERLACRDIDLTIVYGAARDEDKMRGDDATLEWGVLVPSSCIGLRGRGVVLQRVPADIWAAHSLYILPHESSLLLGYFRLLVRCGATAKVALWGHGANFSDPDAGSPGNRLHAWTALRADWWFAYTSRSVARVLDYGYPEERITKLDNAVDTRALAAECAAVGLPELRQLRTVLGLDGMTVGVFLGSLHRAKRLGFLFAAADMIRRSMPEFALLVVGDGPLREQVADFSSSRPWCHWAGSLQGRRKAEHLALGSLLLNPGMVGLGILDGFACGLPLVTTDCGIHSPEIAYLDHGRNGLIVEDAPLAYVDAVLGLLADTPRLTRMAAACRSDARRYTVERMAEAFATGIVQALAARPLRGGFGRRQAATSGKASP